MPIRFKFNAKERGLDFKTLSILHKLRQDKKSNKSFEVMLSNLTLEEVIALRLELGAISMRGKFFNLPLWYTLHIVVRDALLKYVVSVAKSQREAAYFLGMTPERLFKAFCKHCKPYFSIENFDVNKIRDED